MRLSQRSYPHPVVGNADDVPEAAFQATTGMTADKDNIYIDVKAICSSSTINRLLKSGGATYVLHVECSNTLYRKAFDFKDPEYRVPIKREFLNDDVDVNTFVRALKDIPDYKVDKAHPDYGSATFVVKTGDILARAEGFRYTVESAFDSMNRVGSIMQIQESDKEGDLPMRTEINGDKIVVILSKPDFALYKQLKSNEGVSGPLTTTIVLPVLLEALRICKNDSQGEDDTRRWVRALTQRVKLLDLETETDQLLVAQRLLDLPIRRSLLGAKQLVESHS